MRAEVGWFVLRTAVELAIVIPIVLLLGRAG
jgi:hypothetical protein